ncbi:T-cell surface glycoprotein CD3 epsilon chain-like [Pristis pectinata]|uniref:T-cell surface glycoprotein CD3 epsilon chain-like n=1 Tax=Pristis pectinata TaxID=685728 RepID=UPI00223CE45C|nr:T-cell surface glycoprotein CD3 epsilon chain-like [Pristis pectinata]XP_051896029.1 T-cell surface glycoprotein CD3 epsilon chain-like [Pristis pectinata]XP_051896030.1 T-cell surface glycoprotein CD3 epsilon chain-like [Pristis pectinata]
MFEMGGNKNRSMRRKDGVTPMDLGAKMLWTYSGIVIAATLLLQGVAAQTDLVKVDVKNSSVTLTCPGSTDVKWYRRGQLTSHNQDYTVQDFTHHNNGAYYCEAGSSKYNFYIRVKVCRDCIELSTGMVIGIICGDLLFTLLVAGLVYWFAKRKGAASKDFRPFEPDVFPPSRPPHMSAAHQTEYAPIKSGQREVYDKLQRR